MSHDDANIFFFAHPRTGTSATMTRFTIPDQNALLPSNKLGVALPKSEVRPRVSSSCRVTTLFYFGRSRAASANLQTANANKARSHKRAPNASKKKKKHCTERGAAFEPDLLLRRSTRATAQLRALLRAAAAQRRHD